MMGSLEERKNGEIEGECAYPYFNIDTCHEQYLNFQLSLKFLVTYWNSVCILNNKNNTTNLNSPQNRVLRVWISNGIIKKPIVLFPTDVGFVQ